MSDLVRPRILITSAEVFDEVLKEQVRADFEGEIYNSYGAIEVGRIGIECPAHEGLHVTADQLIVECVEGVVVVTSFGARVMPMIRYRLGDLATPIKEPCSCGAPFPLLRAPSGRDNDMIRLPSGKLLSPIGLQFILRRLPGVDQFRFVQERTDHIVLLIASRAKPSAEALSDLRLRLLAYCQEPLHMEIQLVDFIEGDRPKFKSFVSRLGSGDGAEPRSAG